MPIKNCEIESFGHIAALMIAFLAQNPVVFRTCCVFHPHPKGPLILPFLTCYMQQGFGEFNVQLGFCLTQSSTHTQEAVIARQAPPTASTVVYFLQGYSPKKQVNRHLNGLAGVFLWAWKLWIAHHMFINMESVLDKGLSAMSRPAFVAFILVLRLLKIILNKDAFAWLPKHAQQGCFCMATWFCLVSFKSGLQKLGDPSPEIEQLPFKTKSTSTPLCLLFLLTGFQLLTGEDSSWSLSGTVYG